ncbi:MAG: hypothetical protein WAW26_21835, partial [Anaerolineae bacterium]
MKSISKLLCRSLIVTWLVVVCVVAVPSLALAQFASPTVNGTIAASEYGTHTNGQNQETSGSQTWYMTWDDTNMYVGIAGASTGEAAVIYLDKDPLSPINGGTSSNGTIVGNSYDGTNFAELQFRADLVLYVKNGYREYRTANGSNSWSSATSGFGSYADSGSNREFSIPWSVIGGRPSSFAWFGYVTSSGGFVYGQVPTENSGGNIGTSARYVRYYTVSSTTDGSSTKPFARNSYVFNSTSDLTGFETLSIYDFTMNTSGRSLTRADNAGGAWTISGNMRVDAGTVSFGSTTSGATVSGNVDIGSGGTLTLSSAVGGDLNVGGDWTHAGTFTHNSREVTFNGASAQTINGATTFAYLYVNNASSTGVSLNAATTVNNRLKLGGLLTLGGNNLIVDAAASVQDGSGGSTFSATNMVVPTSTGEFRRGFTGTGSFTFPVGDNTDTAEYSPVTLNFTSGAFSSAYAAVRLTDAKHPSNTSATNFVTRYWTVTSSGISSFSCSASFFYLDADIAGTEASLYAGKYNGSTWTLLDAVDAPNNKLSGTVTGFSDFTGGEQAPLSAPLASFDATQSGDAILVTWETVSEIGNLGFNLWRGTSPNAPDVQLNSTLIPSQAPGSSQGFSYEWLDAANLVNNTTYYYWLEDVDIAGVVTRHGPISATYSAPTAVRLLGADSSAALPGVLPLVGAGLLALAGVALWR